MKGSIKIRQEQPADYAAVRELVKKSFATLSDDDGTTHDYLDKLREKEVFIPELSLVAESESGQILGQVVLYHTDIKSANDNFTEVTLAPTFICPEHYKEDFVRPETATHEKAKNLGLLVLSPICVHPDYFKQGIARAMMEASFEKAKALGYKAVFLCGEPAFYNKLGFVPTYQYGIYHIKDKKADWCMVRELISGALKNITGTIDIV